MTTPKIGGVPFKEAIDALEKKTLVTTAHWDEMLGAAHGRAFTIAGVTKVEMLNDFKKSLLDIRKRGGTITDFRKEFDSIVERYGWSYKGKRGWRTKVIFDTNMRTMNAAGRWAQIERRQAALKERDPDATLYMTYRVIDHSARRRELHQQWNDITLPVDHSWWDTHYAPNGYGCACYIIVRTQRDIDSGKVKLTKNPPEIILTERVNKRTGEIYPPTADGIDVGFDHHHGKSAYFPKASGIVDDRLGHQVVAITVTSKLFQKFVDGKLPDAKPVVVGYLPDGLPGLIGAKTNKVYLSADTVKKQVSKRKLTAEDYARLPELFWSGMVIHNTELTLVFFRDKDGKLWEAVVKSTRDGEELYLTTYHRAKQKDIRREKKRGKVVREEL